MAFYFLIKRAKLRLACGSTVAITPTGSVQDSGVGQPSHSIRICGTDVWSGPEGTLNGPIVLGNFLPIELTNFDAKANGSQIDFIWQTATELNNDYFTIEGSTDGYSWILVQRLDGAGTISEVQDYTSTYDNGATNFTYFSLKQTDFDGKMSYSDIVAVDFTVQKMEIYPNPNTGTEININLPSSDPCVIQIMNTNGQTVYSKEFAHNSRWTLNDLALEPGTYFVHVKGDNLVVMERLIVQ